MKSIVTTIIAIILSISSYANSMVLVSDGIGLEPGYADSALVYSAGWSQELNEHVLDEARVNPYGEDYILWSGHSTFAVNALNNSIVEYTTVTNSYLTDINISCDYRNLQAYGGALKLYVGEVDDSGAFMWKTKVWYVWQRTYPAGATSIGNNWYNISVGQDLLNGKLDEYQLSHINAIVIEISDTINYGKTQYLNNVVIEGEPMAEPVVTTFTIEKAGLYTSNVTTGSGMIKVLVNGVMVVEYNSNFNNLMNIGMLEVGDVVEVLANGNKAEEVNQIDYQSWDIFYAAGEISIHVEDPPVCEQQFSEEDLHAMYQLGASSVICDDGNNGHGNDVDGHDESNPGKSRK